ncbi:hypothetical protein BCR43DRAFT_436425 [Syncephalastrum racemosum]|uniref:E3 ubiquitin-protein ligase RNF216 RING finger HC subclass domain-containing protein n=1 Tax=Syncephalastrum racemosum TaxID=13706 RepID=A0A1X2HI91_SYNRA|nr:hypothetical protein BCR43DRAFT_436425 [Syncephalastrum racemosum]
MKKSWKRPKSAIADDNHCESLLQQLMVIFPNGDPGYFRECLQYYESDHITRVTDKIFEMGGYYPMVTTCDPVKQLNHALRILATDLFPDCEVAYLRQRLLQYNHSHLEQVSDELLNEQARLPERLEYAKISRSDMFRSETYKSQAQTQLAIDYPQAWKSSIRAVLAENNWDYLNSYDQLREIGPGGLWIALRNFVKHWIIPGTGSSSSSNAASSSSHHGAAPQTSSFDPDFMEDMEALRRRHLCAQEMTDSELARQINEDEYTKENQLITCNCCYGDFAFEQLAFCSEGEHTFCHDCITHYISEGLFGQGSLRGAARIGCISVEGCQGSFSTEMLERILTSDIWSAYQHSLFEESIVRACRSVVRCAACSYCEVDESIRPLDDTKSRLSYVLTAAQLLLMVVVAVMCFLQNSIIPMLTTLVYCYTFAQWDLQADLEIVYGRIARARRGSIFRCQNQACAEMTCLQCNRVARGLHNCLERDQDGLRLYVEKAMADAVTRTV